jgi:hypothetical protein
MRARRESVPIGYAYLTMLIKTYHYFIKVFKKLAPQGVLLPSQLRSSSSTSNSDLPSVFRPSDVFRTSASRLFSSLALIS